MLKFKRPSGSTIEIANTEANVAYAEENNWELIGSDNSDEEEASDEDEEEAEEEAA